MFDIAASVLAKFKNKAKISGICYQQCMQLFFRRNPGLNMQITIYMLTNFGSRATVDVDFLM